MCPRSFRFVLAACLTGLAIGLAAVPVTAAPIVSGFERFGRHAGDAPGKIEAGLLLLGELGCVNSHAAGASAGAGANETSTEPRSPGGKDNVVDAEFEEVKDKDGGKDQRAG